MPINLETINTFLINFDPIMAKNFISKQTKKYLKVEKNNFDIKARSQIGDKLYDAFIKNYTFKQWGKHPKDLPSFIFNRLPLRFDYREDYYKNSLVEGIPSEGYTKIFERLIDNKNIKIQFNSNFEFENNHNVKYLTIYTGPLDKLLKNKFGKLE